MSDPLDKRGKASECLDTFTLAMVREAFKHVRRVQDRYIWVTSPIDSRKMSVGEQLLELPVAMQVRKQCLPQGVRRLYVDKATKTTGRPPHPGKDFAQSLLERGYHSRTVCDLLGVSKMSLSSWGFKSGAHRGGSSSRWNPDQYDPRTLRKWERIGRAHLRSVYDVPPAAAKQRGYKHSVFTEEGLRERMNARSEFQYSARIHRVGMALCDLGLVLE